ncbi:helix-turn-helix transcriptional regulator [Paenibacillus sp. LX16]|uniref:helix-turn-helix domain-containing protein n=1 Tax=Paenibacillus sp. LX16 TaxID=1740264 RepID=UPI002E2DE889|nr:helix-turn-helix transcriptional regulator [Paenibacillus sp. LX16]
MHFSSTIKEALKYKGFSASDLARLTGYTPQYIHDLLAGNRRWNETTISKACNVLELEIKFIQKKAQ